MPISNPTVKFSCSLKNHRAHEQYHSHVDWVIYCLWTDLCIELFARSLTVDTMGMFGLQMHIKMRELI